MIEKAKEFFNNITPEQWKNLGIIAGSAGLGGLAGGVTNLMFQPKSSWQKILNVLAGATAGGTLGGIYSPLRPDKVRKAKEAKEKLTAQQQWEQAKKDETARQDAMLALNTILPGYFVPTAGDRVGKGATVAGKVDGYYDSVDLPTSLLRWATNPNLAKGKLPGIVKMLPKKQVKSLSKAFRTYMKNSPELTKFMGKVNTPLTKLSPAMAVGQTATNIGTIAGKAYDTVVHREDRIKNDLQKQELYDVLDWGLGRRLTHNFVDNAVNVGRDVAALKGLPGGVKNPLFSVLYTGRTLQNLYDFGAMMKDDIDLRESYNTGDPALDKAIRKVFKRETGIDYGLGATDVLLNSHADENGELSLVDKLWIAAGGDSKRMDAYAQLAQKAYGNFDWKGHRQEILQLAARYRDKNDSIHAEEAEKERELMLQRQMNLLAGPVRH